MDPKGSNLASTDLLEISELVSGSYVTKSITGAEIIASVPPSVTAWGTITGTLSAQTDLNTALSGKVPTTRTLTINGTTQDLSADRTFTVSTGITIGTTAITSGTVGRVLFEGTGNVVQESANITWNNSTNRFQIIGDAVINTLYIGLGGGQGATNTAVGVTALNANTTGVSNTAFGFETLLLNSTGSGNCAFGRKALRSTTGASNIAIGNSAMENNTSGTANIAFGEGGGNVNTTGSSNIFIGNWSTGVVNNVSNRTWIGNSSTTSTYLAGNVLINTTTDAGFKLDVNGTARVVGQATIQGMTVGLGGGANTNSVAIGLAALINNSSGTSNTAVGSSTLNALTSGSANTAIGFSSLGGTNGTNNTGVGNSSLRNITSGSLNTAVGAEAGRYISDGVTNLTSSDNSVFLGMSARPLANSQTNQIVIGHNAIGAGSNTATLGNTSIVDTILRGRVNLQQYATGSRPTYVKGALIYDSTLSKLVVGGASGWEVVTSI